jgi:PBP1b-binding outer membrane lipoprotein LpoB
MKKSISLLLILALLFVSCASPRGVGNTREASKSQRYNQNRVGTQFIGIR